VLAMLQLLQDLVPLLGLAGPAGMSLLQQKSQQLLSSLFCLLAFARLFASLLACLCVSTAADPASVKIVNACHTPGWACSVSALQGACLIALPAPFSGISGCSGGSRAPIAKACIGYVNLAAGTALHHTFVQLHLPCSVLQSFMLGYAALLAALSFHRHSQQQRQGIQRQRRWL
jgi:hypothetical protein